MAWHIYTDGSCLGNPGPGGWGFCVLDDQGDCHHEQSGGEAHTTNNRMELQALIQALAWLEQDPGVAQGCLLYSDSMYVIQGLRDWVPGWERKGWKTAAGKPVKNVDLWQELVGRYRTLGSPELLWVRGHSEVPGNERADGLARAASERFAGGEAV